MVGPGNFSLYVHTCVCNILCKILSAYRCKCCRTFTVRDLSAVRFGLGIQGTVDKWRSYNLCRICSVATHSPGHLPIRLVNLLVDCPCSKPRKRISKERICETKAVMKVLIEFRNAMISNYEFIRIPSRTEISKVRRPPLAESDAGCMCEVPNSFSCPTPGKQNNAIRCGIRVRSAQFL